MLLTLLLNISIIMNIYVFKLHLSTSLRTNKNLFCTPLLPPFTASCFNTQTKIKIYGDFAIQAFEKSRMITLKKSTCPEYV